MTFGLIMLALACLGTYFYYTHLQTRQNPELSGADRAGLADHAFDEAANARLAAKAASLQAQVQAQRPQTLNYVEPGAFVKMKDVGLNLLSVDGQVSAKHLFKQGLKRWHSIEIDSGAKIYAVSTLVRDESGVYLSLDQLQIADLGLSSDAFSDLKAPAPELLRWAGSEYGLYSQDSAMYCHQSNELEQEPCLIWHYRDSTAVLALTLIRWQDNTLTISAQVKVNAAQISILLAP